MFKQINTKISIIEAETLLIWKNYVWGTGCKSCDTNELYIHYKNISPTTGKWHYSFSCSWCGKTL